MDVLIQLMNGRQYRCVIGEGQSSAEFLDNVRFWELFESSMLRFHRPQETWALNPGFIESVHFQTEADPGWRPPENIIASKCISREAYQRKMKEIEVKNQGRDIQFVAGRVTEALVSVTLASGATQYFEYVAMLKTSLEQRITMSRLFQKVAYTIPCEDGGFILLNPAHIVCIRLYPAPSETPETAWLVNEIEELS